MFTSLCTVFNCGVALYPTYTPFNAAAAVQTTDMFPQRLFLLVSTISDSQKHSNGGTNLFTSPRLAANQIPQKLSLLQQFFRCCAFTSPFIFCSVRSMSLSSKQKQKRCTDGVQGSPAVYQEWSLSHADPMLLRWDVALTWQGPT